MGVAIGWVHGGHVRSEFAESLLESAGAGLFEHFVGVGPSCYVAKQRNELATTFLEHTESDRLWMVDTDQVWSAEAAKELLAIERPIVGALYVGRHFNGERFVVASEWDEGRLIRAKDAGKVVAGVGMGCTVIERVVLERLFEHWERPFEELTWGEEPAVEPIAVGEDTAFCLRAGALGYETFLADVRVGHIKEVLL